MIESVSGKTDYLDDRYQIERFDACRKISVHLANDFYQILTLSLRIMENLPSHGRHPCH